MYRIEGLNKLRSLIRNIHDNIEEATMDGMEEAAINIYNKLVAKSSKPISSRDKWNTIWSRITKKERDIRKARSTAQDSILNEFVSSLRIYRDPSRKAVILAPDIEWSPIRNLSLRYRFIASRCPWWRTLRKHEIREILRTPKLKEIVIDSLAETGRIIFETIKDRVRG